MAFSKKENGVKVMRVVLHRKADKEAVQEFKKYRKVSFDLAVRFRDELDSVIIAISHNPFLCHNRGQGIFSVRLKVFPYSVFYKIKSDHVRVLAVLHYRRNPMIWQKRR